MVGSLQGRAWPVLAKIEGGFLKDGSQASLGIELTVTGQSRAGTKAATKRRTWLARTLEPGTQWEWHRCGNEWATRKRGEPEWWTKKQGPDVCPECQSYYNTAPPL